MGASTSFFTLREPSWHVISDQAPVVQVLIVLIAVEYIAGKSFLFISFKKKYGLALLSIRRSP